MNIFSITFFTTVLVIGKPVKSEALVERPNGITWNDAASQCTPYGMEYNPLVLEKIEALNGKLLWIGKRIYQQPLPWIEILGCYQVIEIVTPQYFGSIGLCQQNCSITTYFAFKNEGGECRCINEKGSLKKLSDCLVTNVDKKYMLVYQHYNKSEQHKNAPINKLCMISTCDFQRNVKLSPTKCDTMDDNIVGVCVYNKTNSGRKLWMQTKSSVLETCRREESLLLPSDMCNGTGIQVWSNVFRVIIEIELPAVHANGLNPSHSNSCISAYITQENKTNHWIKERRSCNDNLKWFVCKQGILQDQTTVKTTTHFSTMTKVTSTSSQHQVYDKGFMTSETYERDIFENKTFRTTAKTRTTLPALQSQSLGVILGSVFGVITLSTVIIAVCVFSRKRGLMCFKDKRQNTDQVKKEDIPVCYSTTPNPINKQISKDNPGYNVVYISQVNDTDINSPIESTCQKTTEPTYSDSSDGVYDRLNEQSRRKPNISEIEHLYDSSSVARSTDDPTYVTANGSRSEKGQNDIYDHSFPNSDSYDEHYG